MKAHRKFKALLSCHLRTRSTKRRITSFLTFSLFAQVRNTVSRVNAVCGTGRDTQLLKLPTSIGEVPGSILGRDVSYIDLIFFFFSCFYSSFTGKRCGSTSRVRRLGLRKLLSSSVYQLHYLHSETNKLGA